MVTIRGRATTRPNDDPTRPLRVLRVIARLNVGGPARQTVALMTRLPVDQYDQRLLAGATTGYEVNSFEIHEAGVPVTTVLGLGRNVRLSDDLRALVAIVRHIREFRPDIVDTHTAKAGVLGRLAAIVCRVPVRVHTFHGHLLYGYFTGWRKELVLFVERFLARHTTVLVSGGATVGEELREAGIGRPPQFRVIAPGSSIGPVPECSEARRELGIAADAHVVLFMGRLPSIKRPDRLLDVVRVTTAHLSNVLFVVAGDGELRAQTEATAVAEGLPMMFLGWRSDIERLLAAADVALLTSDNEGMPVSLIEASLAGVPSVASRVGSVAEVVVDGRTGFLVEREDVDAYAERLITLLTDPEMRAQFGSNAKVHAEERLGSDRMALTYGALYNELCGRETKNVVERPPARVLRVIARLNVGGPAMQTAALASLLPKAEFEQRILSGELAEGEASYEEVRSIEIGVTKVPGLGRAVRPLDDLRAVLGIIRHIRQFRPDIVHTHTAKAGALGRVAAIVTRVPIRIHTFHGHLLTGYFTGWKLRMVVGVERALASRTTALVSVGEAVGRELVAAGIGRPSQYSSIAPGVELGPIPTQESARHDLGIDGDSLVVLFVGRLTNVKRPDRLLEIVRRVAPVVPNVTFVVAGDGELRSATEAAAVEDGLPVRFLGWRGDIPTLLAASDVVVLTSDNEGMPVSLIEAAHAGIPCVTTRVGSVNEVVLDGATGYIIDIDDLEGFAARTESLLRDTELRRSMGEAARTHAMAALSRNRLAEDYRVLYHRLLDERRKSQVDSGVSGVRRRERPV